MSDKKHRFNLGKIFHIITKLTEADTLKRDVSVFPLKRAILVIKFSSKQEI